MRSLGKLLYVKIDPVDRIILQSAGRPLGTAKVGGCLKVMKSEGFLSVMPRVSGDFLRFTTFDPIPAVLEPGIPNK